MKIIFSVPHIPRFLENGVCDKIVSNWCSSAYFFNLTLDNYCRQIVLKTFTVTVEYIQDWIKKFVYGISKSKATHLDIINWKVQ